MKYTVIIPSYRSGGYLEDAIESVLHQRLRKGMSLHLIVVADGCKASYRIAKKMNKNGINVLLSKNEGCYRAINTGLALLPADTDMVCFLGADDLWHPERLITVEDCRRRPGEISVHSCKYREIDADGVVLRNVNRHTPTGSFIYPKIVFEKLGGYMDWRCGADTEFWWRAERLGAVLRVSDQFLFYYRQHSRQLTAQKKTGFGSKERKRAADHLAKMEEDDSLFGKVDLMPGGIEAVSGKPTVRQLDRVAKLLT